MPDNECQVFAALDGKRAIVGTGDVGNRYLCDVMIDLFTLHSVTCLSEAFRLGGYTVFASLRRAFLLAAIWAAFFCRYRLASALALSALAAYHLAYRPRFLMHFADGAAVRRVIR